jgi:hypothetical protein
MTGLAEGLSRPEKDRCNNYSLGGGFLRALREWISGFHDRLRTRPSSLFKLFGWSSISLASLISFDFLGSLIPDDGGSTHLWNVGRQSFYTAVYPRRQLWTFSLLNKYLKSTTQILRVHHTHMRGCVYACVFHKINLKNLIHDIWGSHSIESIFCGLLDDDTV